MSPSSSAANGSTGSTSARFDRDDLARLLADELGRRAGRRTSSTGSGSGPAGTRSTPSRSSPRPARRPTASCRRGSATSSWRGWRPSPRRARRSSASPRPPGARIDDDLLATVAELPPPVVREALREVVDRRILVPAGGSADPHLIFRHALLREVIHGELFPGERARYHARFAAALESRAGRPRSRTTDRRAGPVRGRARLPLGRGRRRAARARPPRSRRPAMPSAATPGSTRTGTTCGRSSCWDRVPRRGRRRATGSRSSSGPPRRRS